MIRPTNQPDGESQGCVAQLSGKQVAVVKQSDNSASAEIEAEVLKQVPGAKTVISVLSPPFAQSDGCHRIVDSFWKSATDSGQFEVDFCDLASTATRRGCFARQHGEVSRKRVGD